MSMGYMHGTCMHIHTHKHNQTYRYTHTNTGDYISLVWEIKKSNIVKSQKWIVQYHNLRKFGYLHIFQSFQFHRNIYCKFFLRFINTHSNICIWIYMKINMYFFTMVKEVGLIIFIFYIGFNMLHSYLQNYLKLK